MTTKSFRGTAPATPEPSASEESLLAQRAKIDAELASREAAKVQCRRAELVAELPGLTMVDDPEIPRLQKIHLDAIAAVEPARRKVLDAQQRREMESRRISERRKTLVDELRATAPQEITDAIADLEAQIAEALRGQKSRDTGTVNFASNSKSIGAHVAACRSAQVAINELKLSALAAGSKELAREVARIRKQIPAVDYTLIIVEVK